MKRFLQAEAEGSSKDLARDKPAWSLLPVLSCLSAGGERSSAIGVAAAWTLLYYAAHILDTIEDDDTVDWVTSFGEGIALNAATAFIVSAFECLGRLRTLHPKVAGVTQIEQEFRKIVMLMSSGQHLDLSRKTPSLAECWRIAERKSAAFFALACRAGARCATSDRSLIDAHGRFGHHVGMIIQIGDDWGGIWGTGNTGHDLSPALNITLPVAYAMEVGGESALPRIRDEKLLRQRIERSGAKLYLRSRFYWHKAEALRALRIARPDSESSDYLHDFLTTISMDIDR